MRILATSWVLAHYSPMHMGEEGTEGEGDRGGGGGQGAGNVSMIHILGVPRWRICCEEPENKSMLNFLLPGRFFKAEVSLLSVHVLRSRVWFFRIKPFHKEKRVYFQLTHRPTVTLCRNHVYASACHITADASASTPVSPPHCFRCLVPNAKVGIADWQVRRESPHSHEHLNFTFVYKLENKDLFFFFPVTCEAFSNLTSVS